MHNDNTNLLLIGKDNAPAKINLYLEVCEQRKDGYHNIKTIFYPLPQIYDEIEIFDNKTDSINIDSNSYKLPNDNRNLCWKVANDYAELAKIKPSWNIYIKKNIPIAAGLGGGSSDAASVLKLLQEKYNALSEQNIKSIALKNGADIPFFLNPVPAIATGIGEVLTPIKFQLPKLHILIIAPLFPVPAKWAYNNLENNDKPKCFDSLMDALKNNDIKTISANIANDLEVPVFNKFPLLTIIKDVLIENEALNINVTGSGPTLFTICTSEQHKSKLKNIINKEFTYCKTF